MTEIQLMCIEQEIRISTNQYFHWTSGYLHLDAIKCIHTMWLKMYIVETMWCTGTTSWTRHISSGQFLHNYFQAPGSFTWDSPYISGWILRHAQFVVLNEEMEDATEGNFPIYMIGAAWIPSDSLFGWEKSNELPLRKGRML